MQEIVNLGDIVRRDPPDHPLIHDLRDPARPRVFTAGEMRAAISAVARGLLKRGYQAGDRIGIISQNRWEFLASYFGIMSAGMIAVPVNFRLPRATIAFVLADAGVRVALVDREREALVPDTIARMDFDGEGPSGFGELMDPGTFDPVQPTGDDVAKILYTSGSTGRPKGVPLSHAGQLWSLRVNFTGGDAPLQERSIIVAPTYHKNGLFFTSVAVSNGISFVSLPRFDARTYLETVARCGCTLLSGIPTMFALMARERDLLATLDLTSVRTITIGSAPLTDALLQRVRGIFPNAVCQNGYGTTEAGPAVFGPHPDGRARPSISLGYPLPEAELRLVGGATADEGVLFMRTPALMAGYLNLPDVTAKRIVDGWYDSGDIMRRDAEGFYYFVGRADDMFNCGGENVYPGEVEKVLERCPDVAQAAVVPIPDDVKGEIPVAFVVRTPGSTIDEKAVKAFALREGPAYAHPRFVIFCQDIPVASTHKVDRTALIEEARAYARAQGR